MRGPTVATALFMFVGCGTPEPSSPATRSADESALAKTPTTTAPMSGGTGVAKVGDVTVRVVRLAIFDDQAQCDLLISVADPAKSVQFQAWSDKPAAIPLAKDDLGNAYRVMSSNRAEIDPAYRARMWFHARKEAPPSTIKEGSGQVTAELARADRVLFEVPAPKASKIVVTLPAANVSAAGTIRFDLPRTTFVRDEGLPGVPMP